jgi:CRP/FNR family transcriptional regulator, nitrogen fixation regulation protein
MSVTMNTPGTTQYRRIPDQQTPALGWQQNPQRTDANAPALLATAGTTISLPRDSELHAQDDTASFCYRLISGCIRTVKLMEDGRRQVGAFLLAGDWLGFDALDTHDFAAQAVTDIVVQRYRRRDVEALTERHPTMARWLREMAGRNLRQAYDRMLLLGRKTASERITTFLLEMAGRQGTEHTVVLPMGRGDIADHLGLTIETVCRMMAHLRREGTITLDQRGVVLRDRTALRNLSAAPRH